MAAQQRTHDTADSEFRRILVISLAGFGDAIMSTPLCCGLRQRFPEARIDALTMWGSSGEVYNHLGVFDRVWVHNFFRSSRISSLRLLWELRQRRYGLSITTFPANRGHYNLVTRMIGARVRLGHEYLVGGEVRYGRFLLTDRVRQQYRTHHVIENLKLGRLVGVRVAGDRMSIGSLGRREADSLRASLCSDRPLFGIHPGCSPIKNQWRRRWPAEKYGMLASRLAETTGGDVLVFLGPDEEDVEPAIARRAPSARIIKKAPIARVAGMIRLCDQFICSDSSLGHLAAACRIPTVQITGPTDPCCIGPWRVPHRIVRSQDTCGPCFQLSRYPLTCPRDRRFSCVRSVSTAAVLAAGLDLLEDSTGKAGVYLAEHGRSVEITNPATLPS